MVEGDFAATDHNGKCYLISKERYHSYQLMTFDGSTRMETASKRCEDIDATIVSVDSADINGIIYNTSGENMNFPNL